MGRRIRAPISVFLAVLFFVATESLAQQPGQLSELGQASQEGDYVARDFHFKSGETLSELRLHCKTFGKLARDASGRVTNAVPILHGTTGSGRQFLVPQVAGVLFGPGQLLDTSRYFVIIPDRIGHGKSNKLSDGMAFLGIKTLFKNAPQVANVLPAGASNKEHPPAPIVPARGPRSNTPDRGSARRACTTKRAA
jgi:pimeloyl-ACP methyl ester carboxylesterase